jgi:transposase-like protein
MRVYSSEFRMQVVRRILHGEKIAALSQELGIHRKVLYEWVQRVSEGGESNWRRRGVRGKPMRLTLRTTVLHAALPNLSGWWGGSKW